MQSMAMKGWSEERKYANGQANTLSNVNQQFIQLNEQTENKEIKQAENKGPKKNKRGNMKWRIRLVYADYVSQQLTWIQRDSLVTGWDVCTRSNWLPNEIRCIRRIPDDNPAPSVDHQNWSYQDVAHSENINYLLLANVCIKSSEFLFHFPLVRRNRLP